MTIHLAKLMTQSAPLPPGATLVGWINRHPERGGIGHAVIRFDATGITAAWDGASVIALPNLWRERVEFEAAPEQDGA